jgi:pyruvate dehydrogenase E2 component (dihydrolipoamide acetyltransferase)
LTHNVIMPHLGLTMEEGSVVSWRKHLGERIEKGEVLFTVETDKAEMEVEATDGGYLTSIQVKLGEKVPVGSVIATLGDTLAGVAAEHSSKIIAPSGAQVTAAPTSKLPSDGIGNISSGAGTVPPEASPSTEFAASPRARRLSQELGIDIIMVKPARGPRVVEEDVRRFLANQQKTRPS